MAKSRGEFEYDVALSFAGENRQTVEKLASLLKAEGFEVFYDNWKKAELWGTDLYQHLDEVYSKKARFCVVFVSAQYAAKAWTNHELKSAQARAFEENQAYILPVRLDDTEIPGIRPTLGYLDLRKDSIEEVVAIATEKIKSAISRGGSTKQRPAAGAQSPVKSPARSTNLKLKKQFTEHDRDTYVEEAYEVIAKFFEESLTGLKDENPGVVGKYRRINADHFTAIIYRDGKNVSQCGIRLGGAFGSNQIVYSSDPNSTNSMNAGASVVDDGYSMYLKATNYFTMTDDRDRDTNRMKPDVAAEMFWAMLIQPLQR